MNNLNAIGRLGRNGETRVTQAGKKLGSFAVAIEAGWGQNKKTTWVDCTLWGDRAENLMPMLIKGDRIGISGEVYLETYDTNGGEKTKLCCRVSDVTLLGEKRDAPRETAPPPQAEPAPLVEDDIPF